MMPPSQSIPQKIAYAIQPNCNTYTFIHWLNIVPTNKLSEQGHIIKLAIYDQEKVERNNCESIELVCIEISKEASLNKM